MISEKEQLLAEKLQEKGWLSNEQAHELRLKLVRTEANLAMAVASIDAFRAWRAEIIAVVNRDKEPK